MRRTEERDADEEDMRLEQEEQTARLKHEEEMENEELMGTGAPKRRLPGDSKALRELVDQIQGETREEIYKTELNVDFLRREKIFEKKLRPWLETKIDLLMGGPQSDLVEYILRRVNAAAKPDELIQDLMRYLDDNADTLVERMWRMLVFELVVGGIRDLKQAKEEKKVMGGA